MNLLTLLHATYTLHAVVGGLTSGPGPQLIPDQGLLLADSAYAELRLLITAGQVAAGTRIREAQLARQLKISRTPVREALRRLQAEHLVRPASGGGFVVVEVSTTDLKHVYAVRAVLEGLAAQLAATQVTRTNVAQLEDAWEAMDEARRRGDERLLTDLNSQFHDTIARAAKNPYLQTMLSQIRDIFERARPAAVMDPSRREDAHREHLALLQAIRGQDAATAQQCAQQHVSRALQFRIRQPAVHAEGGQ